jgi:hypothetical protein
MIYIFNIDNTNLTEKLLISWKYWNIKSFYTSYHSPLKCQLASSATYSFSHHKALSIVFYFLWLSNKKHHFHSVKQYTYSTIPIIQGNVDRGHLG